MSWSDALDQDTKDKVRKIKENRPFVEEKEAFLGRVEKQDGCWVWTGGTFWKRNNVYRRPARAAYILWGREDPGPRTRILRTCGNLKCVNPDHLTT